MLIERTAKEVIIRLSSKVDTEDLQDFLNYARYKELTSEIKVSQKEVDRLASKVNTDWWAKNRKRFIK
jgi:predicted nucleotide-binding protein (sugar kinase/HSP70/actin superfamily)